MHRTKLVIGAFQIKLTVNARTRLFLRVNSCFVYLLPFSVECFHTLIFKNDRLFYLISAYLLHETLKKSQTSFTSIRLKYEIPRIKQELKLIH